ncbi:thiamine phosphate synthase [Chloroflexota bacterium]
MPSPVYRLLDANFNRASEGLRVAEDTARFVLDDAGLSASLKAMRHDLARMASEIGAPLLSGRDSPGDVGRESGVRVGSGQRELLDLVRANLKRAQESLRVIEEYAQTPEVADSLDAGAAESLRYRAYDCEREIVARLSRRLQAAKVRGLYVIVDLKVVGSRSPIEVAGQAARGGAAVIQLRDKTSPRAHVLGVAREMMNICDEHGVLFVVNDYVDIAAAIGAPAVHVGQSDIPIDAARRLLPLGSIVGVSCHSMEDVLRARASGADYVAVGSVFPTVQKENPIVVGTGLVFWAREQIPGVPLVAIGGIDATNVADVVSAGADAVALIGAVVGKTDVLGATKDMVARVSRASKEREKDVHESA